MKTETKYSVGILDSWLLVRTNIPHVKSLNLCPGKSIPVSEFDSFYVHEDDLKKVSLANPYSIIRQLLIHYWNESRRYSDVASHAGQAMRKRRTGHYDTEQQTKMLERYNVFKNILNDSEDTKIIARDPNREKATKRSNITHPKLIKVQTLLYISAQLLRIADDENNNWMPKSVQITDTGEVRLLREEPNSDLFAAANIVFEAPFKDWIAAWCNYLTNMSAVKIFTKSLAVHYNDDVDYPVSFEQSFITTYYYDIDVKDTSRYPMLPVPSTKVTEDAELVNCDVMQEELSDDDIFPKPDGETIIVPEPNMTDKMFAPKNRLKFPIHCRAFYLSWKLILRAERSMLEDYCRVVERVIKARYPDLKIEFNVESTNQVVIIIRDYDLEEEYPLVDYTIDIDQELEKPISRLTDNRLFRRIRILEGIVDECHELFYEFCRTEYLKRQSL